jgi:hypothetical protein
MRKLGESYLVETGVVGCLRGCARSTGLQGKRVAHLTIVEGTEHLFTTEMLGPRVGTVRTEWFVGRVNKDGLQTGYGGLAVIADLPAVVRERYRLVGADLLAVVLAEPGYFRDFPTKGW